MKVTNFFAIAAVACGFLTSCGSSSNPVADSVEYIPVQLDNDGKWGMIGADGKMLFSDEFTNQPTMVVNGVFSVKEGETYSLYEASDKPTKPINGCDDLYAVGTMMDGVIPATHVNGRITFLDKSGKTVGTLNPVAGKEIVSCSSAISDGLFLIETEVDSLCYGYADKTGKIVIEPKYAFATSFSEGLALVGKFVKGEESVVIIDKKGAEVARLKKDIKPTSFQFVDGLISAKDDDNRCGFINKKGEFTKVSSKAKRIGEYNKEYFAFLSDDNQWGLMNMEGEVLIRAKYGELSFLPDGNFFVKDDDVYLILDKNGDKVTTYSDYDALVNLKIGGFAFLAKDGSHYQLLDKGGKPICKDEFYGIGFNTATSNFVHTDYFNADAIVQAVLSNLTKDGFGKYRLNESVASMNITDPGHYTYSTTFYDNDLVPNGWRYSTSFHVNTNEYIAKNEYNSFYYSEPVLNKDAKISSMELEINAERECWKSVKAPLIAGIEAKGFKIEEQGDTWVTFKGDKNIKLGIRSYSGGENIEVNLAYFSEDEAAVAIDFDAIQCDTVEVVEAY